MKTVAIIIAAAALSSCGYNFRLSATGYNYGNGPFLRAIKIVASK